MRECGRPIFFPSPAVAKGTVLSDLLPSSTATIFHPAAPNIMRIDSPDQFEKAWRGVFERIKKSSGRTSPPYMNLNSLDLRVEKLSEDVALDCLPLVVRRVLERRN